VGDFEAPDEGKIQGESLLDEGVDVIYGIGGKTGNGGLTAAKERGKWGVGVDVDQYFILPNERDILITSTMKRLDNAALGLSGVFSRTNSQEDRSIWEPRPIMAWAWRHSTISRTRYRRISSRT
jgi:hypothetical protein